MTTTNIMWGGACYPFPDMGSITYFSDGDDSVGSITFYPDCTYVGDWTNAGGMSGTYEGDTGAGGT